MHILMVQQLPSALLCLPYSRITQLENIIEIWTQIWSVRFECVKIEYLEMSGKNLRNVEEDAYPPKILI